MAEEIQKENKMGYMPIPKLLFTMSMPMIISMLVQALYNVVDSAFVAKLNEDALTAVSMAFPVQNLVIAVAVGTGVGINALLSRSLGEKQYEQANFAARNGLFLGIASYLVFAVLGLLGSRQFYLVQTDDPELLFYGTQYVFVVTVFSFGLFLAVISERLLQSTGLTIYNMYTQGLGAVINIILDPILIFGLFGFPRLEVLGAAVATVVGQICGMLLGVFFNLRKNKEININMKGFRPDMSTIKRIYQVGIPSIIMQSIGSVMVFGINKILMMFTSTAVSVFGVYFKLQSFIFMPVFGLNNGMVPIIAYNYGAREKKRIMQTAWLSIGAAVTIMLAGLGIFHVFAAQLLGIFEASPDMLAIGVPALRIISLSFSFAGYGIVAGSIFQALGNGVYSLMVSVARQLLVILPAAFVLAQIGGLNAVWWAFPIAEIVAVIMSTILFRRIYRIKIQPLTKETVSA